MESTNVVTAVRAFMCAQNSSRARYWHNWLVKKPPAMAYHSKGRFQANREVNDNVGMTYCKRLRDESNDRPIDL